MKIYLYRFLLQNFKGQLSMPSNWGSHNLHKFWQIWLVDFAHKSDFHWPLSSYLNALNSYIYLLLALIRKFNKNLFIKECARGNLAKILELHSSIYLL